jgi:RNA polymerase sigma factor (sigma-70 family)
MVQTITNYTTYDQAYYYADLKQVSRLTDQARRDLLAHFPADHTEARLNSAQQQFVGSYLGLAKHLAIELCPRSAAHRLLPDLIGAANLALVEIVLSRDLTHVEDLTPYLAAWLRGAMRNTLADQNPIKMDQHAWAKAKAVGREELLHVASLDAYMQLDEDGRREEPYVTPITPNTPAPVPDPIKRAKVEEMLCLLPSRTQTILRLRYGLGEEDERAYSVIEIAARLGLTREIVNAAIHNGMARLRALAEGKATITRRNGRACISYPALDDHPITEAQEATFRRACAELLAEGGVITGKRLAQASGVSVKLAQRFLRVHREESPKETRAKQREARLEEAYKRLTTEGKPFTGAMLARAAHVDDRVAHRFLKERRGKSDAVV